MEKYSQFRDKGTGIAPFFPVPTEPAGIYLPLHVLLFLVRVPILLTVTLAYFVLFAWLPIGSLGKKAALWMILGVPGIWWVDLQVDGVKKGSLGRQSARLPQPSSIIVSSSTSPIDAVYLAAIFDPIFTISYPHSRLIQRTTLLHCILRALLPPRLQPSSSTPPSDLTTLSALIARHPDRVVALFSECTTTNGRAILPLSPSLLSAPRGCKIFPTSLRYASPDVTTPVPGWSEAARFLWNLCASPSHTIRVRVAAPVFNTAGMETDDGEDGVEGDGEGEQETEVVRIGQVEAKITEGERRVLDKVGEALARLGRVKRVSIGVKEKVDFVRMWTRRRR